MTSFFPDLNVWLALSVAAHPHSKEAWAWFKLPDEPPRLIFCWYTQLGLLRLLTNQAVMGEQTLTMGRAWTVFDTWLKDPRVAFYPEPRDLQGAFRQATAPFAGKPASHWVGDCYLLAWAARNDATLVTFDRALREMARKQGHRAIIPG